MERNDDQRKRGALDTTNDLAMKGRSLYQWTQRARQAIQAAQAAAAAIGSGAWIPFVIAGVVIIIIVFIIILGGGGVGQGAGLSSAQPTPGGDLPGGGALASCPAAGGTILTGSFQADPLNGHCSGGYGYSGCLPNSRRAKSIDVATGGPSGSNVVLPSIEGKNLNWTYVLNYPLVDTDCSDSITGSCGNGFVFVSYLESGQNWTLHLLHLGNTTLALKQSYQSGTIVGKTTTTHVHISIGENIKNPESPPPGGQDVDQGWLAADKDVGMCVVSTNTASNTCTQQYEGTGPCTPSNLMSFFGNDSKKALIASLICQAESCSNQFSFNNACTTGDSLDYSIGFFQINALAHCDPQAFSYSSNPISCTVIDEAARQACETKLFSAEGNIQAAVGVSNNGTNWTPWSTWTIPNSCGIGVVNVLTKCGISY